MNKLRKIEVGKIYNVYGMHRQVLKINNNWCLLKCYTSNNICTSYDVVKIKVLKKDNIALLGGSDVFYSTHDWGSYGYTFYNLCSAESKLNEVVMRNV